MPAGSSTEVGSRSHARSSVTGKTLLPGIDGRSTWVRRLRDLINLHTADLGGEANVSAAEQAIIRRAGVLIVELERLELRFAQADLAGQAPDPMALDLYQRMANTLRRQFEAIGIQRRPRELNPPLSS